MTLYKYISVLLVLPALLAACTREPQTVPEVVVPFSVTVNQEPQTRASFDGDAFGTGNYVFSSGDKLYVEGADGKVYGTLDIVDGAGSASGTFKGSLTLAEGFEPEADTELSATLVGTSQGDFFTISGGRITAVNYPETVEYGTVPQMVQKYSHLTANFLFPIRTFTLTQQSVFLNFTVLFYHGDLPGEYETLDVELRKSGSAFHTVKGAPVGGSASLGNVSFTTVFKADAGLANAETWLVNSDNSIQCSPDFASDVALAKNKYYHVARSAVEPFTIEAPASGTGATVTFNYPASVEYKIGDAEEWTACPSEGIVLSPGGKVSFRGQGTSYKNTDGGTPLFSSTNSVLIYGDVMSLMCDENLIQRPSVGDQAFQNAFKELNNIDIHPDKALLLSAIMLGTSCYEGMFEGCTALTKLPILPATTMASMCYNRMFFGCTGLTTIPEGFLPATTLAFGCYAKMFSNCTGLVTVPDKLLPATTLAKACYHCMFAKCSSLVKAPELPATKPEPGCYFTMFRWCTSLQEVKCNIYLDPTQYAGTEKPSEASSDAAEQEVKGMSNWTTVSAWTVFNKWLQDGKNATDCVLYKNSDMTYSKGTNVGQVPNQWEILNWTISPH